MKKNLLFTIALALSITTAFAQTLKDPATYAPTATGEQLTNLYLNSAGIAGGVAVYPGGVTGDARGMTVVNHKMYLINRVAAGSGWDLTKSSIVELDGITGALLRNITLPAAMAMQGTDTIAYPYNDIQVDEAGHLFVSNMTLDMRGEGVKKMFRLVHVDVNQTPLVWETVMEATLAPDLGFAFRVDTYDLYGDVLNGNGLVMLAISGNDVGAGNHVIKYTVKAGVVDTANPAFVELKGFNPKAATASGTAPRVNIIDENYFYHDGFNTVPTLFDINGNVIDGFQNNVPLTPNGTGQNGITEFDMNGSYYMICASTNTDKTPPQAFDIFKYKDASRAFKDMTLLYRFPEAGMGNVSNPVRTALPRVEVVDDTNGKKKAMINLYAYRNGYGIYELKSTTTGLNDTRISHVVISFKNNTLFVSEEVKSIEVYTVSGQKIAAERNVSQIAAPVQKGIYLVNVTDNTGAKKTQKISVQ